jgi:hypothetical protein
MGEVVDLRCFLRDPIDRSDKRECSFFDIGIKASPNSQQKRILALLHDIAVDLGIPVDGP